MSKPTIEIRVKQKNLSVNGKRLDLEDNFEGAGIFVISNTENEIALELNYRKKKDFCGIDEQEKIYKFLEKIFDVHSTNKDDFKREVYPAVAITGVFKAVVYSE